MNSSDCFSLYESDLFFHVSAKPPLSSCFYRFWCSEWCCLKEVWFGGMVSCISGLQRAGVMFKLYRLSGKKNGNPIWTEKGRSCKLFYHLPFICVYWAGILYQQQYWVYFQETRLETTKFIGKFWIKLGESYSS